MFYLVSMYLTVCLNKEMQLNILLIFVIDLKKN